MRSLCRPTNELLITGVLSSSVVIACDQCLESRGFNSRLQHNFFFPSASLHIYHSIYYDDKIQKNWKQWLCKIWGDKQRALWSMGKW